MSEAKHTPGPWISTRTRTSTWEVRSEDYGVIAMLHDPYAREQNRLHHVAATAKLIAAAPDLLAALEGVCDSWDAKGIGMTDALAIARTAIARARGKA